MEPPTSRAARRAATAQRIIEAAQAEFGEHGLEGTSLRAIARRAGVDASLVIQHYGTKQDLFAIATKLEPESDRADLADHLRDVLGVRLGGLPPETQALVRSMLTAPEARDSMRDFLNERIANLAGAMEGPESELRAALIVTAILGLTLGRHFLELDGLSDVTPEQLEQIVQPWLSGALSPPSA